MASKRPNTLVFDDKLTIFRDIEMPIYVLIFPVWFMLLAMGVSYLFVIKPIIKTKKTNNWVQTPCAITSSEAKCSTSGDYFLEIYYTYEYDGKNYTCDKHSFWDAPSINNRKYNQRIVDKYRPGMETVCFVNSADPTKAVLTRDHSSRIWGPLLTSTLVFATGLILFVIFLYKVIKN